MSPPLSPVGAYILKQASGQEAVEFSTLKLLVQILLICLHGGEARLSAIFE